MKMSEVEIKTDVKERLKKHPLIEVNYKSLIMDFNIIYKDVLDQDHPEEMPKHHLEEIKSNLFSAFCYGAVSATDTSSNFRRNFNLPKDVMEKISKKKIITPDNSIQVPKKDLIL